MAYGLIGGPSRSARYANAGKRRELPADMPMAEELIPPPMPTSMASGMQRVGGGLIGGGAPRMPTQPMAQMQAPAPVMQGGQTRTREQAKQAGLIGSAAPKQSGGLFEMFGYDPEGTGMQPLDWLFSSRQDVEAARARKAGAESKQRFQSSLDALNLSPQDRVRAEMDPEGFFRGMNEANTANMKPQTDTFYDPVAKQWMRKPVGPMAVADGADLVDPETRQPIYSNEKSDQTANIRQVGNQIVERQEDGSWKPVYTGSNAEETARAFQGFIDAATGEQMVVMSNGVAKGTGRKAYVPAQITSVGGVPTAVDKRTLEATQLSPLEDVAGNAAAMSSAKVQGGAQGQVAFDLPVIEMRAQSAINSISDLKRRDIGQRFGLQGKLYAIPGTDGADVQALVNQVTSQAFLNAFEQLKGGGAITEREGQAATQAITRLQNQNITIGEAMQAMEELDAYYRKAVQVARERAVKAPVLPLRPETAAGFSPQDAQRPLPQAPTRTPWLTQQTQRITGMAQPAASGQQLPPGVTQEMWDVMDDEDRAAFQ